MATTDTYRQTLEEYRVAMIEELGFSPTEAKCLVSAYRTVIINHRRGQTRRYELRVDWHYVRKLLDAGATKEQVLAILL